MGKLKLRSKDLRALGIEDDALVSQTLNRLKRHFKRSSREEVLGLLKQVLNRPKDFLEDEVFGPLAEAFADERPSRSSAVHPPELREQPLDFPIYGAEGIEPGALQQMHTAMKLPVAVRGALMPDAHQGYGLPIGGVLATDNAVIPFGVGVDIGCRMALSIYDLTPDFLERKRERLKDLLIENTRFGRDAFHRPLDDEVLERPEFREIPLLRKLRGKAAEQIGTSGSGNHFVEFGIVKIRDSENEFGLPPGDYVALLSHSGSRNFGASIAKHYTQVAMEKCKLPKFARHLAWLDLDSEEGQEYWKAMNLAGDYASANHRHIHFRISKALGEQPIARVENHHNFAWKERLEDGREVIVHRKGATPAGKGVLGVIPGSMTLPGFIVRGRGNPQSLQSAAHGAGRVMSRTQAKNSITRHELQKILAEHGVELIGGGLDEAPIAYKDIHDVMNAQQDLVEIVGIFQPKIVRMDK